MIAMLAFSLPVQAEESSTVKYGLLNFNGVSYYMPDREVFAVGAGVDVAQFYDGMFSVRAEAVASVVKETDAGDSFIGLGVGLNIPKIIKAAGGNWIADAFNPSLTLGALANFEDDVNIEWGIGINFLQW